MNKNLDSQRRTEFIQFGGKTKLVHLVIWKHADRMFRCVTGVSPSRTGCFGNTGLDIDVCVLGEIGFCVAIFHF